MERGRVSLLALLCAALLLPQALAAPAPQWCVKGAYAKYDLKMTIQVGGSQATATGEMGWEVVERTSSDLVLLVHTKVSVSGLGTMEYKYKVYMDPSTGEVKKIERVGPGGGQQIPMPAGGVTSEGAWAPTDIKEGSKVSLGRGRTATVVGAEDVTDASGRRWSCWKAVTSEGLELYFDKLTGLLIKMYLSKKTPRGQIELLLLLKDTNISAGGAAGALGVLGYITIGGYSVPVLALVLAAAVVVVAVVALALLRRRLSLIHI